MSYERISKHFCIIPAHECAFMCILYVFWSYYVFFAERLIWFWWNPRLATLVLRVYYSWLMQTASKRRSERVCGTRRNFAEHPPSVHHFTVQDHRNLVTMPSAFRSESIRDPTDALQELYKSYIESGRTEPSDSFPRFVAEHFSNVFKADSAFQEVCAYRIIKKLNTH